MPDFVRRIVSGPKARYVDPKLGYDLDLVYVTDRLIIMGWPASNLEALYRNKRKDVRKFLDTKHGDHYRIYNLCPCTENTYDADYFHGAVSRYPFPDHHPPPLSMIPMFVADMTAFFAEDPSNVAVIHCKAGKGRSGTMACSYLLSLPKLPPSPQSSRNIGNKHDRKLMEEHRRANKKASEEGETSVPTSEADNPGNGALRLFLHPDNLDEAKYEMQMKELTARLDAVFEFHTSRRLKPAKSSSSSRNQSISDASQVDDSMAPVMERAASSSSSQTSPLRPRKSLSNMVGSITKKSYYFGSEAATTRDCNKRSPDEFSGAKKETHRSPPRLTSKSMTNLRALGVSPAGTSRSSLGDHLEPPVPPLPAAFILRRQQGLNADPWASSLSIDDRAASEGSSASAGDKGKSSSQHSNSFPSAQEQESLSPQWVARNNEGSPPKYQNNSSSGLPGIDSPTETDTEGVDKGEEVRLPRLAVSIPSQRRWVGYWGRMLAGMDPRAALDSSLMHPNRRKIKILQIYVDRRAANDVEEGHLSVHIARYNSQLIDRVETWERGARRRQRAFGSLDPGAPSPSLTPPGIEEERNVDKKAKLKKEEEKRWQECEKRNREHQQEYDRMMRQHGNDTGVGRWGINVMAERDTIRRFHWDDDAGSLLSEQLETVAVVSEQTRFALSKKNAEPLMSKSDLTSKSGEEADILRYVFNPSQASSTHHGGKAPQMTWTKPSASVGGLNKLFRGTLGQKKKDDSQGEDTSAPPSIDRSQSPSSTSNDTWPSHLSTTPPRTTGAASSTTSEESHQNDVSDQEGVIIDADREVQLKVLLGRSGATHSKLPDILSAGYLWFIPAFETPSVNGRTTPKKGQIIKCQFGIGEIDFRKGKKAAPLLGGGEIRSITIEFEWVEVGWHEGDDDEDDVDGDTQ
jgi:phosphatidylinositol-3,4,5-trisphosphate 3-phosphatase/dual-specificity protein phosphatase PTEN